MVFEGKAVREGAFDHGAHIAKRKRRHAARHLEPHAYEGTLPRGVVHGSFGHLVKRQAVDQVLYCLPKGSGAMGRGARQSPEGTLHGLRKEGERKAVRGPLFTRTVDERHAAAVCAPLVQVAVKRVRPQDVDDKGVAHFGGQRMAAKELIEGAERKRAAVPTRETCVASCEVRCAEDGEVAVYGKQRVAEDLLAAGEHVRDVTLLVNHAPQVVFPGVVHVVYALDGVKCGKEVRRP